MHDILIQEQGGFAAVGVSFFLLLGIALLAVCASLWLLIFLSR